MSIRSKIFLSFLVVVVLMLASLGSVFFFHLGSLVEYKKVSDNLVHENELSQKTIALVETYNAVMLAPSSNERKSTYRSLKDDINGIHRKRSVSAHSRYVVARYASILPSPRTRYYHFVNHLRMHTYPMERH